MDPTVLVTDNGTGTENGKHNVSVILVPESVLRALSESGENLKNGVKDNSDLQKTVVSVNQNPEESLNNDNLNGSQVFVIDSEQWLPNSNFPHNVVRTEQVSDVVENSGQTSDPIFRTPLKYIKPKTEKVRKDIDKKTGKKLKKCTIIKNPNKNTLFQCKDDSCTMAFGSKKDLQIHSKSHEKSNTYHCDYPGCLWSFSTPYKLKRHAASHEQTKSFKCNYPGCQVSCSTSYNLKTHEKFHTDSGFSICEKCNKVFNNKFKFQKHQRVEHGFEPRFPCPIEGCLKKFHTEGARKVHIRTHSKLDLVCDIEGCGKRFKQPAVFREHLMSRHMGLRPFKCSYEGCTWQFTTKAKLKRHEVTHTGEKKYSCPVDGCKARFSRQEHVRSHLKVHDPDHDKKKDNLESPFEFNIDDYVYYFCPYNDCGSLFTSLVGAKRHIQKLHALSAKPANNISHAASKDISQMIVDTDTGVTNASLTVVNENVACENDKVLPEQSEPSSSAAQSILTTLMQVENNAKLAPTESLLNESTQFQQVQLNFVPTDSINISLTQNIRPQIASPTTTIDPSQFLLEPSADFNAPSETGNSSSEPMRFINLHQSIYSSSNSDGFLSFNDCVQTVDPNAVMAVTTSQPLFKQLSETSDDEDVNNNPANTSGSARTDCNAYKKIKIIKKWNPISTPNYGNDTTHNKGMTIDLDTAVNSFSFGEGECISEKFVGSKMPSGSFKTNLPDRQFTGSTINLSDLA